MCGIAGLAGLPVAPATPEGVVRAMNDRLRHRGPDGYGEYLSPEGHVAFGMRRLAIIDVAGGWQPLTNEAGTVHVVFNGEIYNFRPLRQELERLGHRFATRSDTEVIVHGYEAWGEGVLDRLDGMFAIALWDAPRRTLLLARDRLGIKPLYLWTAGGGIAFASELKAFHAVPGFAATPSTPAVLQFLALGYVPDPLAALADVRKLAPGTLLRWQPGAPIHERRYWDPTSVPEQADLDEREAIAEVRRRFAAAVESHLVSDVPLGAFLSGGIDSSAVVAQMGQLMDRPVRTFTIGFAEDAYDEAADAAVVARALGTNHTALVMAPAIDEILEELVLWFDEPFGDWSALPTYLVSRLARDHVTVALSGDGGDELFGGYTRYPETLSLPTLPSPVSALVRHLAPALPSWAPGRRYLANLGRGREGRYAATVAEPLLPEEGGLLRAEQATPSLALARLLEAPFARAAGRDFLNQMMLVDLQTYLPGDILTKVDRMSMRVSLEARVPLLDHRLAEFAIGLPARLKRRDGTGKWIFREAIRPLLPPEVFHRPKRGFTIPMAQWFRGPLRHRLTELADPESPVYQFVDPRAIRRFIREHLLGRRDHALVLWRVLVLHLWLRGVARQAQ